MMPAHAETVSVTQTEWNDVVSAFPSYNFEQSAAYTDAMAKSIGGRAAYLVVKTPDACLGGASVRIKTLPGCRRGIAYITGGILISDTPDLPFLARHKYVLERLATYLKAQKHTTIVREPIPSGLVQEVAQNYGDAGFQPTQYARTYRTILLDIAQDPDAIRTGFAAKWRRDLNTSLKSDLQLETGSSPAFQDRFMQVYETMVDTKELDLALGPEKFFDLPAQALGLQILIATKDGKDAAVHLLSCLGDTAVYLFGASNEIGRATKAGYWIQWQAILAAQDQGCRWYDLGGVDPDTNPGGFRFKSRMGGADVRAHGPFCLPSSGVLNPIVAAGLWWKHRKKTS